MLLPALVVAFGLVVVPALVVAFGLASMAASSEAETVAAADVWDDDGEAEPGWDAEPVAAGDPVPEEEAAGDPVPKEELAEGEPEADGDDDAAPVVVVAGLVLDAGALGEADVEEADGEGVGDGGFGVGVGEGVLAAGSTWHLVTVFALALFALALVEAVGLGEAASSFTAPARASPGQLASTPRVRNTPASRLRTAARACARRMKLALIIGLLCALPGIRRRLGDGWV